MTKRRCRRALRSPRSRGPARAAGLPDYRLRRHLSRRPRSSRSTIRTATAGCSATSTCTCSAKARTTASFEKLGAHRITVGVDDRACTSRCGRPTPIASASSATSTAGTAACTRCGCWCRPASGRSSSPICRTARSTSSRSATQDGALLKKTDPFGVAFEVPPQTASVVRDISQLPVARRRRGWRARPASGALARPADVDLRSAPRLVGARAGGGQPLSDLSRAGATGSCRT